MLWCCSVRNTNPTTFFPQSNACLIGRPVEKKPYRHHRHIRRPPDAKAREEDSFHDEEAGRVLPPRAHGQSEHAHCWYPTEQQRVVHEDEGDRLPAAVGDGVDARREGRQQLVRRWNFIIRLVVVRVGQLPHRLAADRMSQQ